MALQICRVSGATAWEACRTAQPGATIFHRWDWLATMAPALDKHFLPLGFYCGDALVGLAPLLVKRLGPYKNANWAPFPYLGPLVPAALWPHALQSLDDYQRRNGIGLMQFGLAPDADADRAALRAAGYALHEDTTMVLPLAGRSEEELRAGMTSHGRKNLKRAERGGVDVRAATELDITRELPAITGEVFAPRQQPPPYPPSAARVFWDRYHDDSEARMATACCAGEPAAISITVGDGHRAYFWQGAAWRRFRNLNPNAALYWDGILWARARLHRARHGGHPRPGHRLLQVHVWGDRNTLPGSRPRELPANGMGAARARPRPALAHVAFTPIRRTHRVSIAILLQHPRGESSRCRRAAAAWHAS